MKHVCPDCGMKHAVMDSLPKRPITMEEFEFITDTSRFEDSRTGNWIFENVGDEVVGTTRRVLLKMESKGVAISYFDEFEQWLVTQVWDLNEFDPDVEYGIRTKFDILDNLITHMTQARLRCVNHWNAVGQPVARNNGEPLGGDTPDRYPMGV